MIKYTKKEVKHIVIASIILSFVFAFDDKAPTFQISYWLSNFLLTLLSSFMVIIIHTFFQKLMAYHYKSETEYSLWFLERYGIATRSKVRFKFGKRIITRLFLGPILAILIALISKGKLYFAAISSFRLKEKRHLRIGYKWTSISNYELALIASSGPLSTLAFAIFFKAFHPALFKNFITISLAHSIYSMIPISSLDGAKIFFGSRYLYFFILTFIITIAGLINFIPIIATIAIAFILAILITLIVFNKI